MTRTESILQSQATECGLAALAMLLAFHGRRVPMHDLRIASGVSRDGTSARNLIAVAATYGLDGEGRRCDRIDAKSLAFPFIAHCNFNHFVVVEGVRRGRIFLNDPSCGRRDVVAEDFHEEFTGVILTFSRSPQFLATDDRFYWCSTLRWLVGGSWSLVTTLLALRLGSAAVVCAIAVLLQCTVDGLSGVGGQSRWHMSLFALLAVATMGLHAAEVTLLAEFELRLSFDRTRTLFRHVRTLPMEFFSYRAPEWIIGVLESNRHAIKFLCGTHGTALAGIVGLPLLFLVMAHYQRLAAAAVLVCGIAIILSARLQKGRRSSLYRLSQTMRSRSDGYAVGELARFESLKIGERAEDALAALTGFQALAIEAEQEWSSSLATAKGLKTLALYFGLSFMLVLITRYFDTGTLTVGGKVAVWVLAMAFIQTSANWVSASEHSGALRDAFAQQDDVTSARPDEPASASCALATLPKSAVLLEASSLSFGYSRGRPPVIDGVALTLMQGVDSGILALPGSGASTLVRLLTGVQKPWNGEVLLQGRPVRALPAEVLAQELAAVTRNGLLFEGTVRDNVCLWDGQISDEALEAALEDACIADVLSNRRGGYLHRVAPGGANFSGGERQRLLIARALVRAPRLLILDNAMDLLDLPLEALVRKRLRQRECTTLIVSQRLETIQSCRQIFTLSLGQLHQQV